LNAMGNPMISRKTKQAIRASKAVDMDCSSLRTSF
jgi:hypothetical protein